MLGGRHGLLAHGRLMRTLMRVSGAVLVGFGAGLLVERPSHGRTDAGDPTGQRREYVASETPT